MFNLVKKIAIIVVAGQQARPHNVVKTYPWPSLQMHVVRDPLLVYFVIHLENSRNHYGSSILF